LLTAYYGDLFNRPPRPDEWAADAAFLTSGGPQLQLAADVLATDEYRTDLVQGLYERLLDRPADSAGLAASVQALRLGAADDAIVLSLLTSSDEFFSKTRG
jgi:hypothetical protein